MLFHAKSLEVYSSTFQSLSDMDIDKDLEVKDLKLRFPDEDLGPFALC